MSAIKMSEVINTFAIDKSSKIWENPKFWDRVLSVAEKVAEKLPDRKAAAPQGQEPQFIVSNEPPKSYDAPTSAPSPAPQKNKESVKMELDKTQIEQMIVEVISELDKLPEQDKNASIGNVILAYKHNLQDMRTKINTSANVLMDKWADKIVKK